MKRQLITLLSYSSVLTDKIFAEGQKNYFNKYLRKRACAQICALFILLFFVVQ